MPYIGNPIYQSAFVTDQFSGNGSTTAFTMSVAPAGTTNVLVVVSGVVQDPSTYGVSGNTLTFSAAPPSGTGNISCRYLGVPVTGITTTAYRTKTEFTATAGQTTFTPPSYTAGYIDVFRNGVLLGSADYTASNGTTVVLTTGATAGDLITTESFYVSSVLNAIPNTPASVGTSNIQSSVTLTTPTIDKINTSVSGVSLGAGNASIMKNRIINGSFNVWQRGTSITSVGVDTYGPDRFKQWASAGSETGLSTWSQSTDVPSGQGFQYSSQLAVTTAQASFSSSQGYAFAQRIEANNIYDLSYGTSGAKTTTVSFWAKSTKTGTYTAYLINYGSASTNVYKQTVSLTSSWAQYTLTFAGDTSLATTTTGNATGFEFGIMLSNGATSALTNSWVSLSLANKTATGQVNFYDTIGNTLNITGVQLEIGSQATGYEYRMYGQELALCQRYYQTSTIGTPVDFSGGFGGTVYASGTQAFGCATFKITMRASPTVVLYDGNGAGVCTQNGIAGGIPATAALVTAAGFTGLNRTSGSFTTTVGYQVLAGFTASAEL